MRPSILILLLALGCTGGGTEPEAEPDLDALFAPPTAQEIAAVEADWATRAVPAVDVRVELDSVVVVLGHASRVRVLSHLMGSARHYGALLTPAGGELGPFPVAVYTHGGDAGTSVQDLLLVASILREEGQAPAFVMPSFRSETLRFGNRSFTSDGPPSPWDRDVDDAMALLTAAIEESPELDADRIAVIGFSRGGGVGLLMGARDSRVDAVVDFFGPTDFFDDYVRRIVEDALAGELRDLPGLDHLNDAVLQPWSAGTLAIDAARLEMVKRSAVYFVERLPAVQVHHGTADDVVEVSQAERLIAVMTAAGRTEPEFEAYLYAGAGHSVFDLVGAVERTVAFLDRHLMAGVRHPEAFASTGIRSPFSWSQRRKSLSRGFSRLDSSSERFPQ